MNSEVTEAWAFDADDRYITCHGAPIFQVFGADDFPCIEDDERAEAEMDYLAHAGVVVLLLNSISRGDFGTTGEAVKAYVAEQVRKAAQPAEPSAGVLEADEQYERLKRLYHKAIQDRDEARLAPASPSIDLVERIGKLLNDDPVCNGRVCQGTVQAIAGLLGAAPSTAVSEDAAYHVRQARNYIAQPGSCTPEKHLASARWHLDKVLAALQATPGEQEVDDA